MTKVMDADYLYLVCTACDERAKFARNEGGGWFEQMSYHAFLLEHGDCPVEGLVIKPVGVLDET